MVLATYSWNYGLGTHQRVASGEAGANRAKYKMDNNDCVATPKDQEQ